MPTNVTFYSIVPSPYQRDLFYELSRLPELNITVNYLENFIPDSPWPQKILQSYERILPGKCLTWGSARFQLNWHLPNFKETDVIVLNGYQNSIAQSILRTEATKIPCIFWGEKMVATNGGIKGHLQKILAGSLNQCAAIAAIGTKAIQDYQHRYPGKPVFHIPYYCDLSGFSQQRPERPRTPVTILFCGQMIARKGVDLLLAAFSRLVQSGLSAKLLLVGREAELPQMLTTLPTKVIEQIEFAGFQAPEDLPHFFHRADIFVLPSRYDGWGVVVNQALGAGLPIICSDAVGSAPDLVTSGQNGHVFPAGDVDVLYKALKGYLQQPETIRLSSQASIKRAVDWTPQAGAKRWLEALCKVAL